MEVVGTTVKSRGCVATKSVAGTEELSEPPAVTCGTRPCMCERSAPSSGRSGTVQDELWDGLCLGLPVPYTRHTGPCLGSGPPEEDHATSIFSSPTAQAMWRRPDSPEAPSPGQTSLGCAHPRAPVGCPPLRVPFSLSVSGSPCLHLRVSPKLYGVL